MAGEYKCQWFSVEGIHSHQEADLRSSQDTLGPCSLYSTLRRQRTGPVILSLSLSLPYISTFLHPHIVYLCISVINDYNLRLFVIDCEPILYIYKSDRQFILNSQFERVEIQNKCIPKYQRNALFQIQI